jgi:hypothetical protein
MDASDAKLTKRTWSPSGSQDFEGAFVGIPGLRRAFEGAFVDFEEPFEGAFVVGIPRLRRLRRNDF